MSEIWKRKMKKCFHVLDFDKDCVISKKDFDLMAAGLGASRKDDPAYQDQLIRAFDDLWMKFAGATKTNEKKLMTEAVMIDSLLKQRNDPKLKAIIRDFCRGIFEALDANNDGYLQLQEIRRGFDNAGFPDTSFAEHTFKIIDANHDGKISLDELNHAFQEFMLSDDADSPHTMFFGDLI